MLDVCGKRLVPRAKFQDQPSTNVQDIGLVRSGSLVRGGSETIQMGGQTLRTDERGGSIIRNCRLHAVNRLFQICHLTPMIVNLGLLLLFEAHQIAQPRLVIFDAVGEGCSSFRHTLQRF
jgi:hypothetical protein